MDRQTFDKTNGDLHFSSSWWSEKRVKKWGIIHLTNAWVLGKPSKTKVDIQKPKGEFLKVLAAKGAGLESTMCGECSHHSLSCVICIMFHQYDIPVCTLYKAFNKKNIFVTNVIGSIYCPGYSQSINISKVWKILYFWHCKTIIYVIRTMGLTSNFWKKISLNFSMIQTMFKNK